MCCKKYRSKSFSLTLLCLITLYGLASFLYLEIDVMISQQQNIVHIAGVRVDMVKFRRGAGSKRESSVNDVCPVNSIQHPARKMEYSSENVACKKHKSSQVACNFAKKFYEYDFDKWRCNRSKEIRICELHSDHIFVCDYYACGPMFDGEIVVHLFDPESGLVRALYRGYYNNKDLNENILRHAQTTMKEGYPFLYLSCNMDTHQTQLLMFDQSILEDATKRQRNLEPENINLNVILFDSISRAHFYRSLEKTVNFLKEVNTKASYKAEILDFELFQSIHGHTTENLYALWNGKKFPLSMTDKEKENAKTELNNMLEYLKTRGYEILYQEDECWEGFWGLNSDLGNFENWTDFSAALLKNTSIDDTGLLFASCKMIELYEPDRKHVFNTEGDIQICYNGWNMDSYYLQYLTNKLQQTKDTNLFSFTAINLAHDGVGRRVQGIDADLKAFFQDMTNQENTITIIFGDHGNTYSDFVYVDMEGRYEMFHPAMFIIIPEKVGLKLGKEKLYALRTNQQRLMTLFDIHHMLKHLADPIAHPNKGLLGVLPANRTCNDIPMGTPNLCVCDGWDSPVKNTSELMPQVDFAVGYLNNIISKASKYGRCKRIVPTRFQNVLQRKSTDSVTLTFDIFTTPGKGSKNIEEQIQVELRYAVSEQNANFNAQVLSFDRISRFGPYRTCNDAFEKFRLCICDQVQDGEAHLLTDVQNLMPVRNEYLYKIFGDNIDEEISFIVDNKLALLERKLYEYDKRKDKKLLVSVSFEVINVANTTYEVELEFDNIENMKLMTASRCKGLVKKHGMIFLCSLMREWSISSGSYSLTSYYKEITEKDAESDKYLNNSYNMKQLL